MQVLVATLLNTSPKGTETTIGTRSDGGSNVGASANPHRDRLTSGRLDPGVG
jgi:hypothetical protein